MHVCHFDFCEAIFPDKFGDVAVVDRYYAAAVFFFVCVELFLSYFVGSEGVASVNEVNYFSVGAHEDCVFDGAVSAADDGNFFAFEHWTVADSAVAYALAC
jgi:hypothetical protein